MYIVDLCFKHRILANIDVKRFKKCFCLKDANLPPQTFMLIELQRFILNHHFSEYCSHGFGDNNLHYILSYKHAHRTSWLLASSTPEGPLCSPGRGVRCSHPTLTFRSPCVLLEQFVKLAFSLFCLKCMFAVHKSCICFGDLVHVYSLS